MSKEEDICELICAVGKTWTTITAMFRRLSYAIREIAKCSDTLQNIGVIKTQP